MLCWADREVVQGSNSHSPSSALTLWCSFARELETSRVRGDGEAWFRDVLCPTGEDGEADGEEGKEGPTRKGKWPERVKIWEIKTQGTSRC